jgi:hypothetical protein
MKIKAYSNTSAVLLLLLLFVFAVLMLFVPVLTLAHGDEEEMITETAILGMSPVIALGATTFILILVGFILFKIFRKK